MTQVPGGTVLLKLCVLHTVIERAQEASEQQGQCCRSVRTEMDCSEGLLTSSAEALLLYRGHLRLYLQLDSTTWLRALGLLPLQISSTL